MQYPLTPEMEARLERDFTYHPVNDEQATRMQLIRDTCHQLAFMVATMVPGGREQALAITAAEQVSMYANAGIARLETI